MQQTTPAEESEPEAAKAMKHCLRGLANCVSLVSLEMGCFVPQITGSLRRSLISSGIEMEARTSTPEDEGESFHALPTPYPKTEQVVAAHANAQAPLQSLAVTILSVEEDMRPYQAD